jgi:hypothetical protein
MQLQRHQVGVGATFNAANEVSYVRYMLSKNPLKCCPTENHQSLGAAFVLGFISHHKMARRHFYAKEVNVMNVMIGNDYCMLGLTQGLKMLKIIVVYALVLQVGDCTQAHDLILLNKLLRNPEK